MVAPVILSVVAFIAGHPTSVACDADVNPSPFATVSDPASAWTYTGGNVIHALPGVCAETAAPLGSVEFADGIATMIHEAARAHGWQGDSCVELLADIGVYQVLRDFYGVPFFSTMSERIGVQVLALTRRRPAEYQPELCLASGMY